MHTNLYLLILCGCLTSVFFTVVAVLEYIQDPQQRHEKVNVIKVPNIKSPHMDNPEFHTYKL